MQSELLRSRCVVDGSNTPIHERWGYRISWSSDGQTRDVILSEFFHTGTMRDKMERVVIQKIGLADLSEPNKILAARALMTRHFKDLVDELDTEWFDEAMRAYFGDVWNLILDGEAQAWLNHIDFPYNPADADRFMIELDQILVPAPAPTTGSRFEVYDNGSGLQGTPPPELRDKLASVMKFARLCRNLNRRMTWKLSCEGNLENTKFEVKWPVQYTGIEPGSSSTNESGPVDLDVQLDTILPFHMAQGAGSGGGFETAITAKFSALLRGILRCQEQVFWNEKENRDTQELICGTLAISRLFGMNAQINRATRGGDGDGNTPTLSIGANDFMQSTFNLNNGNVTEVMRRLHEWQNDVIRRKVETALRG